MNSISFEEAKTDYKNGNYVDALKGFYATIKEDGASLAPGETAQVYYRIGNCLLKMHNFTEAAAVYQKAIEDPSFNDKGSAQVNLGKSLLGLGRFEDAAASFNAALSDPTYLKPYQAQLGLGNAYSKLGLTIDAGTAYRNAALDERNPNPTKALMSLGSCFMVLGRPQDAIESYNAVFDFKPPVAIKHKTYESLGQALASIGRYPEALDAFNKALEDGDFNLSKQAQLAYAQALQITTGQAPSFVDSEADYDDDYYFKPPYGEMNPAASNEPEIKADGSVVYGAGNVPAANNTGFFQTPDAELIEMSKNQLKGERKLKHTGLKIILTVVVLLILVLGAGVFAFTQGFGIPSQETTINEMFAANAAGNDPAQYWIGSTDQEKLAIDRIMDMVGPTSSVDIVYLNKSMTSSDAIVTAHFAEGGGTLDYEVTLERSGLGWKISGLNLYFASRQ